MEHGAIHFAFAIRLDGDAFPVCPVSKRHKFLPLPPPLLKPLRLLACLARRVPHQLKHVVGFVVEGLAVVDCGVVGSL